jgi:glycosyltransferase involved in cell wall biosynthesis
MDAPLRIAYVIWSLGLGGAEQVVIRLAAALDRRRFQPLVCCLNEDGLFAEEARASGTEVFALHKRGRFDAGVLRPLVRLFLDHRIDIVHTHLWGANVWGRVGALVSRASAIVATEHNTDTWKRPYHFAIDRALARRTTRLVGVSRTVAEFYEARGVGRGRWQVIHNGVAGAPTSATRRIARAALGIAEDVPVVGFVGRFVPAKGPLVFLEAVARASRDVPGLQAVMIGDGPLRDEIKRTRSRLGLDPRVLVAGLRRDVTELLPALDALLFCSEREGLSMAMLEGMAAGVPVLATPVGGTTEIVDPGRTGLLVPSGRADEIAAALVGLLRSPELAARLRQGAQEEVQARFSLRRMVEDHEALYTTCASETREVVPPYPLRPEPRREASSRTISR